eukprot:scaffold349944_cov50-Prasinocladus_malaysianus.AAC.1
MTGELKRSTRVHSFLSKGTMEKMPARKGTYMMIRWRLKEKAMATSSQGLTQGCTFSRECSSDRALR